MSDTQNNPTAVKLAFIPLFIAIAICLVVGIYPQLLQKLYGAHWHNASAIVFLLMTIGFIRGLGYVPHSKFVKQLFGLTAFYCLLVVAVVLIWFW